MAEILNDFEILSVIFLQIPNEIILKYTFYHSENLNFQKIIAKCINVVYIGQNLAQMA